MPASQPNPSRPRFLFVLANDLDSVKLDKDEQVDGAETLIELLQPPLGDPGLNALRQILSMTYGAADKRPSEECVLDIRRRAIKARYLDHIAPACVIRAMQGRAWSNLKESAPSRCSAGPAQ